MKQWIISAMECKPQVEDLENVIITIHWRRVASQYEHTVDVYGAYSCPTPEGEFTPFEDLTKEQVEGWLEAGLDVEAIDANLDKMLADKINPPVVIVSAPWN